ncbi:phospholipase D-like domain-containing protein [Emticicia sp. 17c]|uniref:phospholipase D-like domain-containing protein n=1 Tax=Emticicia sp. 17c TaxID=3127704 RepID=UPI00301D33E1
MRTQIVKNTVMAARAYQGDAMTMLVFDLLTDAAKQDFVGFTIEFKNPTMRAFKALNNRIGFTSEKKTHPSTEAPFQKFRWLHVLRNFSNSKDQPFFGEYEYRITPRYFTGGKLDNFDTVNPANSVTLKINVGPFKKEGIAVAFTRGFLVSQAYTDRFGPNGNIRPLTSDVIFDPTTTQNDIFSKLPKDFPTTIKPYTYEDQYAWMGFNARKTIMDFINEVVNDTSKSLDVLAYDFSEPVIAAKFLQLSKEGRIRMFLDDHDTPDKIKEAGRKSDPEFKKQFADKFDTSKSKLVRHHFTRLAHCKILIQKDANGKATKVLTGSTNFTANGLYINANHILVLTQPAALDFYAQLFEESIKVGADKSFRNVELSNGLKKITDSISVGFSPHTREVATKILDDINNKINKAKKSVFFAVMELNSTGSVTQTLKKIHEREDILTLGITDLQSEKGDIKVRLFEPKSKKGVLINGKKSPSSMPAPFSNELSIGLGHEVHHKFVVVDFNTPDAAVYCGSSNLAQGGEESNGDNLLVITDTDIATVFAIEAIRLIDHYQFRNALAATNDQTPLVLKTDNEWYQKYFDKDNLYFVDKVVFMGE